MSPASLAARATSAEEAWKAAVLVTLSWTLRASGLLLLLGAVGVALSFPLALAFAFLCAAVLAFALAWSGGRRLRVRAA